jgi:hypothetical protein
MPNIKVIIPRGGNDEDKFKTLAEPSLRKISNGIQLLQVFDKDATINENIFKKYRGGIEAALNSGLNDDDIVIFMHSDVSLVDSLFKEKIELLFSEKPDVGLVGVVGAIEITEKGAWWANTPDKLLGHILQGKEGGGVSEGYHLQKGPIGYFDNAVCVDGCIMMVRGKLIKEGLNFDNDTYNGNDFYDLDISLTVLEMGYKVATADILVFHKSPGMGVFNDTWKEAKNQFINKWQNKGKVLPFTADQFKVKQNDNEIVEIVL